MNKKLTFFVCAVSVVLSACTPEIKHNVSQNWQAFKTHDYKGTFMGVTGANEIFPTPQRERELAGKDLCLHPYSKERTVTANGIDDEIGYRHCVLSPAGSPPLKRFEGR